MSSFLIIRVGGPISHKYPYKGLTEEGYREEEKEGHVKMEAQIRITQSQPKECLEPPEAAKGKAKFSPVGLWKVRGSADSLISDLRLHRNYGRMIFCYFKPPSLWQLVLDDLLD